MATTAVLGYYTLMDVVNAYTSLDAKGQYLWAANVLARKMPLIRILPMIASNQIMSNIDARVTFIPTPGTRRFNEGVAPSAGHSTPFTDPIAMVEDYSEVDYALWKIQNDPNSWRQGADEIKVEGLTQKMTDLLWYGNLATDPGAFNGFSIRFNEIDRAPNGDTTWPVHILDQGGTGSDLTSVWIFELGPNKCWGTYPKNLPGGLHIEDLGKVTVNTNTLGSPKYMEALRTHFAWYMGIVVKDERCVQRIANVEVTGTENIFDEDNAIRLLNRLPGGGSAPGTVMIVSSSVKEYLDIRAKDKNNVQYMPDNIWGGNITMFRGVPVYKSEMLDETETEVT